ncbi:hypothetical protein HHUSO_G35788 [Huso huso]|uniref:Uncharacterized protein n=1 Tax=Huso huso TaxID=61971 RepID=A0ABR0Y377_HUSHU
MRGRFAVLENIQRDPILKTCLSAAQSGSRRVRNPLLSPSLAELWGEAPLAAVSSEDLQTSSVQTVVPTNERLQIIKLQPRSPAGSQQP